MVTTPSSASYFAQADRYVRRNYWIQTRAEMVRELLPEQPRRKRILDIGCGTGEISLPWARQNEVVLVDNSAAMVELARQHAREIGADRCEISQADVFELDLEPADIVLAIGLLAHVSNPDGVIASIARHTRARGHVVLQFSDSTRIVNRIGHLLLRACGRNYQPTSREQVLALAESHGLRLVAERSHIALIPGMQRLLGPALVPYDRFVRRHGWLARHGSETLLLLRKD